METFSTRRSYRSLRTFYTFAIVLVGAAIAVGWVFFVFPTSLGEGYGAVIATVQQIQNILLRKVAVIYVVMTVFMIGGLIVLDGRVIATGMNAIWEPVTIDLTRHASLMLPRL